MWFVCLSSTETIFVNKIVMDLSSVVFYTGSTIHKFLYICFGSCCTNERFYNGRQYPLCAEKSMSVQFSRRMYMSVQNISSTHTWVHSIWVFLHWSSWNSFPWVVKDVLQSPDLHGARGMCNVQTCEKAKRPEGCTVPCPAPSVFSLIMYFTKQKFVILMKHQIFLFYQLYFWCHI